MPIRCALHKNEPPRRSPGIHRKTPCGRTHERNDDCLDDCQATAHGQHSWHGRKQKSTDQIGPLSTRHLHLPSRGLDDSQRGPLREAVRRLPPRSRQTGCIVWVKHTDDENGGHGCISVSHRTQHVHRVPDELFAPVPEGLVLHHLCRSPPCSEPDHREPVTNVEDIMCGDRFMAARTRKTHCRRATP